MKALSGRIDIKFTFDQEKEELNLSIDSSGKFFKQFGDIPKSDFDEIANKVAKILRKLKSSKK